MKKLSLAALAVVALAGLAYLVLHESSASPTGAARSASPAREARSGSEAGSGELTPADLHGSDVTAAPASVPDGAERAAFEAPREEAFDRASARWIEGHVALPAGVPHDDQLFVYALSRDLEPREMYGAGAALVPPEERERMERRSAALRGEHAAPWTPSGAAGAVLAAQPVAPGGAFRLPYPAGTSEGWVGLAGRYLFLQRCARVRFDDGAGLVLEPEIGGLLSVRIVTPSDVPASAVENAEVELGIDPSQFSMMASQTGWNFDRRALPLGNGAFEVRAIWTSADGLLDVRVEGLAPWTKETLHLEPGRELALEARLLRGATVTGLVRDAAGAPVAEAEVRAARSLFWGFAAGTASSTQSGADGSFTLEHVPPGQAHVLAEREGYLATAPHPLELADEQVATGIELVLETGGRIAGRVTWADGTPAGAAEVEVDFDPAHLVGWEAMNAARGGEGDADSAADGSFEVGGLGKGPFVVEAGAEREDEEWMARLSGVRPGTLDVELVLAPLPAIDGRVTDAAGAPVREFRVTARAEAPIFWMPGESEERNVEDEDGRFRMTKLAPGSWDVEVSAEGFGPSVQTDVVLPLPSGTEPLVFVLLPAASIAGTVVGPGGEGVAGAKVSPAVENMQQISRMAGQIEVPTVYSDESGAFVLGGLGEGTHNLVAEHPDYAPSETVPVEVSAGSVSEGVELQLREGGRIAGIVYGKEGELAEGVQIFVQSMGTFETVLRRTDADGKFLAENLRPGSWNVTAMLGGMASLAGSAESAEPAAEGEMPAQFLDNMRFTMVEVAEGEETWVELGKPPADPVVVSGRVTHAGEPVTMSLISFFPEGVKGFEALRMKTLDADGAYTIELDAPGKYLVSVQRNSQGGGYEQTNVEFNQTIPEAEEHRLDLELPVGRLSGRVLGPDGDPLSGARVSLTTAGGVTYGTFMGGNYAETTSDEGGRYDFDYLRPGTYSVAAGGALMGGAFGGTSEHGRTVQSGLRVREGEHLEEVDFRLKKAGSLAGSVVDLADRPLQNAAIFVFDEAGNPLERFSMITTGSDGRFRVTGLAPGEYTVSARTSDAAGVDQTPVEVREGEEASTKLQLGPGTVLLVTVIGEADTEVQARVSVSDSRGRQLNGTIAFSDLAGTSEFTSKEQRIGPLPPDTYWITALADDGQEVKKSITLTGQAERKLKIRLK